MPQIRDLPLEIGLCLELRELNLIGNPLDGPFPSSAGRGGEGGVHQAESSTSSPYTWIEAYQGSRGTLFRDHTQKETAVRIGTQTLLSAVWDSMDYNLLGQVIEW